MALNLKGDPPGLLEIAGDDGGDCAHLAEQCRDGRGVVATGLQRLPHLVQPYHRATDVQIRQEEALHKTVGRGHVGAPLGVSVAV